MALKMELPPLMQDSNFKNLELYALDFGITSLNIHDSFRYEVGHYDAIASTLQNWHLNYLVVDDPDHGITAQINLHFIICKDGPDDDIASTLQVWD